MNELEKIIEQLQSRIKSQNEIIDLLKDYNDSLKQWNKDLERQIDELKSGHLCCLETNCPNRVVQRISRIEYSK